MNKTQKTIDGFNEALNKINDVSIIAMDDVAFEKLLAWAHGTLNDYNKQREPNSDSLVILRLAHQMLEKVLNYHVSNKLAAKQNTVLIFNKTVELLLGVVARDYRINESTYEEAIATSKFLRAIRASEIDLPGHHNGQVFRSRWEYSDSENSLNEEALIYASAHIKEYSKFVFDLAINSRYIPDPFAPGQDADQLMIYKKIKSLTTSGILLPSEQPSRNA